LWRTGSGGGGNFQAVAIGADKGTAADVALDEALGFEFGVGVWRRGAMYAEGESEFAAGGDAVTGTEDRRQWTRERSWSRSWI